MIQLASTIYLKSMNAMKKILDLVAFKMDRRTKDFSYAKEEIMNYTYKNLKELFKELEKDGIIKKCSCGRNSIRKGYSSCSKCHGSGYENNETKEK